MKIIPDSKPQISKEDSEKIVKHYLGESPVPPLVIIGIRGYFSHTLGGEGNDINMYDDACVVWGLDTYETFNFNTDPSFAGKHLAMLKPGVIKFYKGKHHNRYNALRPYPEGVSLACTRDGVDSMCSATNIHKGGMNPANHVDGVTYSHGCQTLPPTQYDSFINLVYTRMSKYVMKTVTYILLTEEEKEKILAS